MFFREGRVLPIEDLSDDELQAKIVQIMWEVQKRKTGISELQTYYDEVKRRGKYFIWNKAKSCLNV